MAERKVCGEWRRLSFGTLIFAGLLQPLPAFAAEAASAELDTSKAAQPGIIADTEARHMLAIDGRQLEYVARAGTLTVPDEGEEGARGRMFYVAYALAGEEAERPITFVFNGGPGAAAAYLHMGAMGPRRVGFGKDGRVESEPGPLVDNEETWLPFTDLVFVDPIGTGYSRRVAEEEEGERKNEDAAAFWETDKDLDTLGAFIRLYLSRHERWLSPTVVAGESYGGFRAAALADRLQSDFGISVEGVVMISPALELDLLSRDRFRLMPWISRVPSYAAAAFHHGRAGADSATKTGRADFLEAVESFAVGDLLPGLARGQSLAGAERTALLGRLAGFIGLPDDLVRRYGAKLPMEVFGARLLRDEGRIVSLYDASITYPAPHPAGSRYRDPRLARISAAMVAAFNHHARTSLGIETDLPYEILNRRVNQRWQWRDRSSRDGPPGATDNLENALKSIDDIRALLVHGLYDLVTPYYASRYLLNQLDLSPALRDRITFRIYEGGHMFYSRDESRKAFQEDARRLYAAIVAAGG